MPCCVTGRYSFRVSPIEGHPSVRRLPFDPSRRICEFSPLKTDHLRLSFEYQGGVGCPEVDLSYDNIRWPDAEVTEVVQGFTWLNCSTAVVLVCKYEMTDHASLHPKFVQPAIEFHVFHCE